MLQKEGATSMIIAQSGKEDNTYRHLPAFDTSSCLEVFLRLDRAEFAARR